MDNEVMWEEFVRLVQEFAECGELDGRENNYKRAISCKLAAARKAVLNDSTDWPSLVKRGIGGNLIFSVEQKKFRDWIDGSPSDALKALKAIWSEEPLSVSERVRVFAKLLPQSEISRGNRVNIASVLLMGLPAQQYPFLGLAAEQYPPFRITLFENAYNHAGYVQPQSNADEADLYSYALIFLDQFIEQAKAHGLQFRHRLDVQSVIWWLRNDLGKLPRLDLSLSQPCNLELLADELILSAGFLEKIATLLDEKRQVIFQGPPGTGKTYVAQALARCLAGSENRVELVQFHPSYAYEDFVRGFRPLNADNGQPRFDLQDGPLLRAAEKARNNMGAKHFLIIDEINRGNLAKVFGELYFLLEYRNEEISLQYQRKKGETFSLPENLYIIGTMNTADRSIALVDLALRRRFYFVEFHPDDEPVKCVLRKWLKQKKFDNMEWVADVVQEANKLLKKDKHAAIGPSYFMKEHLDKNVVERIWKHSVLPYIEEHLFGDDNLLDEFDLDKLKAKAAQTRKEKENQEQSDGTGESDASVQ